MKHSRITAKKPAGTEKIDTTELTICAVINGVIASLLAIMVVLTLVWWLSLITALAPTVPEGVRIIAAKVIWGYLGVGDILRKQCANATILR